MSAEELEDSNTVFDRINYNPISSVGDLLRRQIQRIPSLSEIDFSRRSGEICLVRSVSTNTEPLDVADRRIDLLSLSGDICLLLRSATEFVRDRLSSLQVNYPGQEAHELRSEHEASGLELRYQVHSLRSRLQEFDQGSLQTFRWTRQSSNNLSDQYSDPGPESHCNTSELNEQRSIIALDHEDAVRTVRDVGMYGGRITAVESIFHVLQDMDYILTSLPERVGEFPGTKNQDEEDFLDTQIGGQGGGGLNGSWRESMVNEKHKRHSMSPQWRDTNDRADYRSSNKSTIDDNGRNTFSGYRLNAEMSGTGNITGFHNDEHQYSVHEYRIQSDIPVTCGETRANEVLESEHVKRLLGSDRGKSALSMEASNGVQNGDDFSDGGDGGPSRNDAIRDMVNSIFDQIEDDGLSDIDDETFLNTRKNRNISYISGYQDNTDDGQQNTVAKRTITSESPLTDTDCDSKGGKYNNMFPNSNIRTDSSHLDRCKDSTGDKWGYSAHNSTVKSDNCRLHGKSNSTGDICREGGQPVLVDDPQLDESSNEYIVDDSVSDLLNNIIDHISEDCIGANDTPSITNHNITVVTDNCPLRNRLNGDDDVIREMINCIFDQMDEDIIDVNEDIYQRATPNACVGGVHDGTDSASYKFPENSTVPTDSCRRDVDRPNRASQSNVVVSGISDQGYVSHYRDVDVEIHRHIVDAKDDEIYPRDSSIAEDCCDDGNGDDDSIIDLIMDIRHAINSFLPQMDDDGLNDSSDKAIFVENVKMDTDPHSYRTIDEAQDRNGEFHVTSCEFHSASPHEASTSSPIQSDADRAVDVTGPGDVDVPDAVSARDDIPLSGFIQVCTDTHNISAVLSSDDAASVAPADGSISSQMGGHPTTYQTEACTTRDNVSDKHDPDISGKNVIIREDTDDNTKYVSPDYILLDNNNLSLQGITVAKSSCTVEQIDDEHIIETDSRYSGGNTAAGQENFNSMTSDTAVTSQSLNSDHSGIASLRVNNQKKILPATTDTGTEVVSNRSAADTKILGDKAGPRHSKLGNLDVYMEVHVRTIADNPTQLQYNGYGTNSEFSDRSTICIEERAISTGLPYHTTGHLRRSSWDKNAGEIFNSLSDSWGYEAGVTEPRTRRHMHHYTGTELHRCIGSRNILLLQESTDDRFDTADRRPEQSYIRMSPQINQGGSGKCVSHGRDLDQSQSAGNIQEARFDDDHSSSDSDESSTLSESSRRVFSSGSDIVFKLGNELYEPDVFQSCREESSGEDASQRTLHDLTAVKAGVDHQLFSLVPFQTRSCPELSFPSKTTTKQRQRIGHNNQLSASSNIGVLFRKLIYLLPVIIAIVVLAVSTIETNNRTYSDTLILLLEDIERNIDLRHTNTACF